MRNVRVVVKPPVEPVTVAELKAQCRIDVDDEDTLLDIYISAAREWAEKFCQRAIVEQTVEWALDAWPCGSVELPWGDVIEVESVTYTDQDGVAQVWNAAEYEVETYSELARLYPAFGYSFPAARCEPGAVVVRYRAGYAPDDGSPTDYTGNVPAAIKAAILMTAAHWYEHREAVLDGTVTEAPLSSQHLLWQYRLMRGARGV